MNEQTVTKPQNIQDILAKLKNVKPAGKDKWVADCPCTGHQTPDHHLSVEDAGDKALVICFPQGKHTYQDVCTALDYDSLNYGKAPRLTKSPKFVCAYAYTDAEGNELYQIHRLTLNGKKSFVAKRRVNQHLEDGLADMPTVLYNLPALKRARQTGETVYVPEGEKDSDTCSKLFGTASTTNPFGARNWKPDYADQLGGCNVVIIPDNDAEGELHLHLVGKSLLGKAKSVSVWRVPKLYKDITEMVEAGVTAEVIKSAVEQETIPYVAKPAEPAPIAYDRRTDVVNAERFIAKYKDVARYNYRRRLWLLWNGKYWEWDVGDRATKLAQTVARSIYNEVANTADKNERADLATWAKQSETTVRLNSMLTQAAPHLAVDLKELDANGYLLNVANGTVDLKTGELRPHNAADLITKFIDIAYDPAATSELWDKVLKDVLQTYQKIGYYQRAKGYSITSEQSEQCFFFNYGQEGSNGKSTIELAINGCLGDYAAQVTPSVFMTEKRPSSINEQIAKLPRVRLVIATELDRGQQLSTSLLKRMTGGENLWSEQKFEHGYDFRPEFKLWLSGNHEPSIADTTNSIWRRIRKIPFNCVIPPEQRITNLDQILIREHGQAILAWLIQGCLMWQKLGLSEPDEIKVAVAEYRASQDVLHDYLDENCFSDDLQATITVAALYQDYLKWCEDNNTDPISKRRFNERLLEKGFHKTRGNYNRLVWHRLRLLTQDEKLATSETENTTEPQEGENVPF